MSAAIDTVFLLDVDNTLLDNDRIHDDLGAHLEQNFGGSGRDRYWAIFEALRAKLGYADYLGALQRYRSEATNGCMTDSRLLLMSSFLVDYPFASRLYPGALDAIRHLRTWGLTVILSDGDVVFQPDALPDLVAKTPLSPLEKNALLRYGIDEPLLFVGHYWRSGNPAPIRPNLACLDYSAVLYGKLVAYRLDQETCIDPRKFVWVDVERPEAVQ